ncbi:death-inducer obliterator 1 isoform X1 [Drosophila rhopaloa]|uniref:Death-inducer obliterator 1 n=1 Tax=Drosophila rhopaloa TaxID=1041015 RepID=A0ABM5HEF2_DRORH|nr:death-inducer obliterator 1 isoform X1 [Drosophila rhopaloa]
MSSSVFTEAPSARPESADGDSNLVVVYSKNGVSFDERAIGNIMEEKSISTISVVRLTSPTPSMVDQEEAERLEELASFLDAATDSEMDSDNGSQSGGEDASDVSAQDEENQNTGEENNGDSTETETDAPRTRRRAGRKPKAIKKKKRRKPKERPQIVGLRVEQFYADGTADMVVKNALKLAGVSIYKRTAETDALLEVIRNDHNYTPFTSPEQLKNHKRAEKIAMEMQAQSRKIIMQAPGSVKLINAKKRVQTIPFSPLQVKVQRLPMKPTPVQQPPHLQPKVQLIRKTIQQPLPRQKPEIIVSPMASVRPRPTRAPVKVIAPVQDYIEDDDDAQSSDPADEENADKSYDTEEMSEDSEDFQDSDNDRDSDMDFNMRRSGGRNPNKRKRVRKVVRPVQTKPAKPMPAPPPTPQHFPELKKRKELVEQKAPQIGQIIQLPPKAPPTVIALGRGLPSTSFLKIRPTHQTLPVKKPPLPTTTANTKVRRMPVVHLGRIINSATPGVFTTPPPEGVKEIIINKNMASPKGVFTNLNSLLGENNNATIKSSPDPLRHRAVMSPSTPRSSYSHQLAPIVVPVPAQAPNPSKGFMPIGVDTAQSHKLPAQIVIETHQSSSELAAENDKQLDLINSIVQDELLKSTLVDQPAVNADEDIPKLVKMLESTAAGLDQATVSMPTQNFNNSEIQGVNNSGLVDPIDIMETADEDEITADFLQHVVGLIEEDKQFEAEVVKQVLASTEPGSLDSIVSLPALPTLTQAPIVQQQLNLLSQAVLAEPAMTSLPIACSTPSRSLVNPLSTSAKVVRNNGRVIYLPPIEAPTTRAKRRAQFPPDSGMNTTSTGDLGNLSFGETTLETSVNQLANSSSLSNDSQSGIGPKRPNPREPSLARRSTVPRRSKKPNTSQSNDPDASESQEDDDDPNKLWCVCRQPHNNRFMICCDLCADWFHGTCVGVTKAMGTEMEQKGVDWKCPKCLKKQEEKSQPRITEMLVTKTSAQAEEKPKETKVLTLSADLVQVTTPLTPRRTLPVGVTVASSPIRIPMMKPLKKFPSGTIPPQQQKLNFIKLGPSPANRVSESICVVCKRAASSHSVYCGEECIRKYAQSALQAHSPTKGPDSPLPHNVSTQSPLNNSLEAKKNKKKDLFEDVLRQADSVSKVERINVFERRSGRVITGHLAPTAHQFRKWLQENPTFEVLPSGTLQSTDTEKRQLKRAPEVSSADELGGPAVPKKPLEAATKLSQPIGVQVNTLGISPARPLPKKDKEKEKPPAQVATPGRSDGKPEPVRIGIRRSLREQLLARIKEAQAEEQASKQTTSQWLTLNEVDQFVKSVELEMFNSFGRDVGAKYKAKYRSLMFNIKDRKNRTLFEKICAKQVEPKQLVRMTPEQLASQELAKWREEENRHQLDMIKKSELDMLSCAQNYVVKTHKGEEVIATKVDVTLPEEDINEPSTVDRKQTSLVSEPDTSTLERSISRDKSGTSKEKRHKNHKHHHRKRSRSRSNSRGRNVEKRHRRHHNEGESGTGSGGGEREHRSREKQSREKDETVPSPLPKMRDENDLSPLPKKIPERKTEASAYNLIDQILESEKTVEQAANLGQAKPSPKPLPTLPSSSKAPEPMDNYSRYVHGQTTSPLWSGPLKMIDVTEFEMTMYPVQGNCHQMGKLMPNQLDVIGRITRVNVWEYIKKLKKSPTKEVVIVNIFPASPNDTFKFDLFFDYLDSRERLGVMGVDSDQIRDFYIFPLGTGDELPPALQTSERVPFYEDTQRPNTLLGIIVRCLSKRPLEAQSTPPSVPSPVPAASSKVAKKSRSTNLLTPQISPKRKASTHSTSSKDDEFDIDAIIKAPIAKLQKALPKTVPVPPVNNDADEPYSPGGSDDELVPAEPRIPNDLERQVNEINKQIAAQQMEIAGLLKVEPTGSASSSKVLAGISIPPNLSKILASIKDKTDLSANPGDGADEYNPEDAITTSSSFAAKPKSKGRLAHLSEAELLSMVPDNLAGVIPTSSKSRHQQPPPPLPPPPPPPGV